MHKRKLIFSFEEKESHLLSLMSRRTILTLLFSLTFIPFALSGCGGRKGPELSDSRKLLVEARKALGNGDYAKALENLDASIKSNPNIWAYVERAKVNAMSGKDDAALEDCKAALELAPDNEDIPWIQNELKKSVDKRFKGKFANPPSSTK